MSCQINSCVKRRGFSLLELTIVVMILGIMAAIAMPNWTWLLAKYRVDSAAQRIVVDLNRTQSLAYATSSTKTVTFTVAQSRYQIPGLKDLDHPAATYTVDLTAEPYRATLVSAVFGGSSQISYNGFGQPTVAGGTIVVESGGQQRTITVDAASGKGSIQ